ncbi:MAG TPA: hypothetical protein VHS58_15145 [Acetobacteraceae bacterium]|nr:hypothetical protein [Acetobacteraceae bacterium]
MNEIELTWSNLNHDPLGAMIASRLSQAWRIAQDHMTGYVSGLATSTLGIGGDALVVLATALFLAVSPHMYVAGAVRLMPVPWRARGRHVLYEIGDTLRLWFMGSSSICWSSRFWWRSASMSSACRSWPRSR